MGEESEIDAVFEPVPYCAVTIAVASLESVAAAVALKVVLVEPEGTVTVPGTVREELLLLSVTATPPEPAA